MRRSYSRGSSKPKHKKTSSALAFFLSISIGSPIYLVFNCAILEIKKRKIYLGFSRKINPNNANIHSNYGLLLRDQGKLEEATKHYRPH